MIRTATAFVSFLALVTSLSAAPEETIAKAREYLGGDAKLKSVQSIEYIGSFTTAIDKKTGQSRTGSIRIYLERPLKQRLEISDGKVLEITVINDMDGWKRLENLQQPGGRMFLLDVNALKRVRANTHENLNFFTGIEKFRGTVIDEGEVKRDGVSARKLIFKYEKDIYYERYFHASTGELLATVTDEGSEVKEIGDIMVDGLRFPKKIVTLVDGEILHTVEFSEVKVNQDISDKLFDFPAF